MNEYTQSGLVEDLLARRNPCTGTRPVNKAQSFVLVAGEGKGQKLGNWRCQNLARVKVPHLHFPIGNPQAMATKADMFTFTMCILWMVWGIAALSYDHRSIVDAPLALGVFVLYATVLHALIALRTLFANTEDVTGWLSGFGILWSMVAFWCVDDRTGKRFPAIATFVRYHGGTMTLVAPIAFAIEWAHPGTML